MKIPQFVLLIAAIAIPACTAEVYDWDLWRACADTTGYGFSDVHEDVSQDDCLLLPRWQSAGCTENVVRDFCKDELEASYDQCLHQRTNQLCCYRLTQCEQYAKEGVDCSNYEASQNDLETCLEASTAVKDACVDTCKEQLPRGEERKACREACRKSRYAANRLCKTCHRCSTAEFFCQEDLSENGCVCK